MCVNKTIWCIRHGTALHNVMFKYIGTKAYTDKIYQDTKLTDEGIDQAKYLSITWKEQLKVEIVFVSPLTRCLETATHIFSGTNKKLVAIEEIIEYEQANEYCNKRKPKSKLQELFPHIDFSLISEEPKYWKEDGRETLFELKKRSEDFRNFIEKRNEKNICVVSHSTFLKEFLNGSVGDINEELRHCYPLKQTITVHQNTAPQNFAE